MNENLENKKVPSSVLHALEVLLGIGLVLIVYDYSRDFLSGNGFYPTDLKRTSIEIFMSRWITYFGAPILLLVAGIHVALKKIQGWDKSTLAIYLLKRGVFLLFVDLAIVSFAFNFSFSYPSYFMMMAVLGMSYFIVAGLVYLPFFASLAIGATIILGHDLLPVFGKEAVINQQGLLVLFHGTGAVQFFGKSVFLIYSIIPWFGVVALGYGLGTVYTLSVEQRAKLLMRAGVILTLGFVVLRLLNDYGNPEYWWSHNEPFFTALSFINVTKFPASVQYLLMTLGPILMLLSWLENTKKTFLNRLSVYGRTPLFFYIYSLFLIHIFAVLAGGLQGFHPQQFIAPVWQFPSGFGFSFYGVLVFALALIVVSYQICRLVDSAMTTEYTPQNKIGSRSWRNIIKYGLRNF